MEKMCSAELYNTAPSFFPSHHTKTTQKDLHDRILILKQFYTNIRNSSHIVKFKHLLSPIQ